MSSLQVRVNGAWVDAADTVQTYLQPFGDLSIAFFGDSFTFGDPGPSSPAMRFSTRTAALLGATEENFGIGGARNFLNTGYILTQVYQAIAPVSAAPYASVYPVSVIQASINNLNLNAIIATPSIITKSLARSIHRLRAGGTYEALGGAMWSYSGSWTDVPTTDANSGTGVRRATANGATWTLTVPSDFPGGVLRVYGPKATGFGGVHTITVDGTANGTIDNRNATVQSGSETWEYPVTLSAGTHVISGVISSLSSVENINGADFETADLPLVVVLNTARSPNYPGGEHTTTDTDVTNSNTALATMLNTEFPSDDRVVLLDLDALLGKNPANFGTDQIHPDDTGTGLIAQAIATIVQNGVS